MSHTYTNILIHALFSTRDRQPWLVPEMRDETFNYLGGAVNALGGQSLLVNGAVNHVHEEIADVARFAGSIRNFRCVG